MSVELVSQVYLWIALNSLIILEWKLNCMKNNLFKGLVVKGILVVKGAIENPIVKKSAKEAFSKTFKSIDSFGFKSSMDNTITQVCDSVLKAKSNLSDKDDNAKEKICRTVNRLKRDFQNIKEDGVVDLLLKGKSMITIKNGKIYFRKDRIANTILDIFISFTDSFINNLFSHLENTSTDETITVG